MRRIPQKTCQLYLVQAAADSSQGEMLVWLRHFAVTAQGACAAADYLARMAGLARNLQPLAGDDSMNAEDQREQHRAIAAMDARRMPNPHYDRLPAGYQPLEPGQGTERLLDRD